MNEYDCNENLIPKFFSIVGPKLFYWDGYSINSVCYFLIWLKGLSRGKCLLKLNL